MGDPEKRLEHPPSGYYMHVSGSCIEIADPDYTGIDAVGRFVQSNGVEDVVGEPMITYRRLGPVEGYGNDSVWMRPLSDFLGTVMVEGSEVARFRMVDSEEIPPELIPYM